MTFSIFLFFLTFNAILAAFLRLFGLKDLSKYIFKKIRHLFIENLVELQIVYNKILLLAILTDVLKNNVFLITSNLCVFSVNFRDVRNSSIFV